MSRAGCGEAAPAESATVGWARRHLVWWRDLGRRWSGEPAPRDQTPPGPRRRSRPPTSSDSLLLSPLSARGFSRRRCPVRPTVRVCSARETESLRHRERRIVGFKTYCKIARFSFPFVKDWHVGFSFLSCEQQVDSVLRYK
jgi:hypothetical protein